MMRIVEVYDAFQDDLGAVEDRLELLLRSESPLLTEAGRHLLDAGGKRLRPLLVLIAGRFGDGGAAAAEALVRAAAAVELIHMATLVHDDIVDRSDLRRGRETVRARWDDQVAVYAGDFLLARALSELSAFSDPAVDRALARTVHEMSRGEVEQQGDLFRPDVTMLRYFRRIRRKTALLIEFSVFLGARIAGTPEAVVDRLRRYAFYTGMAFQVTDDLLDFTGTPEVLGKPSGSDLAQGNVTLPAIFTLSEGDPAVRSALRAALEGRKTEAEREALLEGIGRSGAFERTHAVAERFVCRAKAVLKGLSAYPAARYLEALVAFIEKRTF